MDEKNLLTHSWGELYETLLEMKEKGDDPHDELFTRIFELFPKLDKTQTLKEVRDIIDEEAWFTRTELDRINSTCLDGIISTIYKDNPLKNLITDFPMYIETLKFYAKREDEKELCGHILVSKFEKKDIIANILLSFVTNPKIIENINSIEDELYSRNHENMPRYSDLPYWRSKSIIDPFAKRSVEKPTED